MQLNTLDAQIEHLATGSDLVDVLRTSAAVAETARAGSPDHRLLDALDDLVGLGGVAALAAIEVLGAWRDPSVGWRLVELLDHPEPVVARHASWRLMSAAPVTEAFLPLAHRATLGGIDTLHAHLTLRRWARLEPRSVVSSVGRLLPTVESSAQRARLVDVLSVADHPTADTTLSLIAADRTEALAPRQVAISALGQRRAAGSRMLLESLARGDEDVAMLAAFATDDLMRSASTAGTADAGGLRVAQLTMAGRLEPGLQSGGRGDTGGVASLLVSLGQTLAERQEVAQVITIGPGTWNDVIVGQPGDGDDHHLYAALPVGDEARPWTSSTGAWEQLPAIERGLTSVLARVGPVDLLHLRMADVGTLAAANVAQRLGIPICFSLAPDPHGVIRSRQSTGELDRTTFVQRETDEHFWFRARLVERLAAEASRIALFPRRDHGELLRDLAVRPTGRSLVVPEGIDVSELRQAELDIAGAVSTTHSLGGDVLDDLANRLPPDRRHLPLVLSVGRLQPIKGMDRVVRAWAADEDRWASSNLVLVGGDLTAPSAAERSVLRCIDEAVGPDHPARSGLILCGGRPRSDVARLLAATVAGRPGAWAPGGVYVNGAYKEEFGLALLEALAVGLPVVAPAVGGPSTYVDDGDTGILVAPDGDLGRAIDQAFALVGRPGRAGRARSLVETHYSIAQMADRLLQLYRPSVGAFAGS